MHTLARGLESGERNLLRLDTRTVFHEILPFSNMNISTDKMATEIERSAQIFAALGEPSRLLLLRSLNDAPLSVNELVSRTQLKQANTSKQLGILLRAGLVRRTRSGRSVHYRLASSKRLAGVLRSSLRLLAKIEPLRIAVPEPRSTWNNELLHNSEMKR